ncbi:hypothetical protein [Sphingopyxis chilensis]
MNASPIARNSETKIRFYKIRWTVNIAIPPNMRIFELEERELLEELCGAVAALPGASVHQRDGDERVGAQYAVTTEAAAQAYAPYLSAISQLKCRMQGGRLHSEVLSRPMLDSYRKAGISASSKMPASTTSRWARGSTALPMRRRSRSISTNFLAELN